MSPPFQTGPSPMLGFYQTGSTRVYVAVVTAPPSASTGVPSIGRYDVEAILTADKLKLTNYLPVGRPTDDGELKFAEAGHLCLISVEETKQPFLYMLTEKILTDQCENQTAFIQTGEFVYEPALTQEQLNAALKGVGVSA